MMNANDRSEKQEVKEKCKQMQKIDVPCLRCGEKIIGEFEFFRRLGEPQIKASIVTCPYCGKRQEVDRYED